MPISLPKIQSLLYKIGFMIDTYFIVADKCEYIKCNSINTGESIIIKIARSFDFRPQQSSGVYNLNLIDFEVGENITEKYSEYPSKKELKKKYGELIKLATTVNDDEMEADLENKYKMNLELKSIEKDQLIVVKSCFRQLRRMALVLTGLKYKMCILHHQYLSIVNDEDVIDSFYIRGYDISKATRIFLIVIDLEYFYEKMQSINHDIDIIQESVYNVLDKNSTETNDVFVKISKSLQTHEGSNILNINKKKVEIQGQITKYKAQLIILTKKQDELVSQYSELNTKSTSYFNDANVITRKGTIKKQLDSVDIEKQKILSDLVSLREKCDNIYLSADNIEFDNCIMMNGILKNLEDIQKIN